MNTVFNILAFLKKVNPYVSPIVAGVLLITCFNLYSKKLQLEKEHITSQQRATTATKIIERYLDDNKSEHLVIQDTKITKEQKKDLDRNSGLVDTITKALKISREQITELNKINAMLIAKDLKGKADEPSNPKSIIRYVDKWANINFNPVDTTFGLQYNIDLRDTRYTRKSGFLGLNRTDVIDLYSPDNRVTINGVERYSLKIPDPNFGLRGQVKAQYNFQSKSVTPAVTLEANFKSYSIESNLFYNINNKKFTPTLGIKKDLFKL